jgi:hypothetical protein
VAVYGSDPYAYNLEDALANAKTAVPKPGTPERIGRSVGLACGKQAGEYARTFWASRVRAELDGVPLRPPTRDELLRHAERFGTEAVADVAQEYGVDMRLKKDAKPKLRRRTNDELRGQVLELASRGVLKTAIADALNVSDRRIDAILKASAA